MTEILPKYAEMFYVIFNKLDITHDLRILEAIVILLENQTNQHTKLLLRKSLENYILRSFGDNEVRYSIKQYLYATTNVEAMKLTELLETIEIIKATPICSRFSELKIQSNH